MPGKIANRNNNFFMGRGLWVDNGFLFFYQSTNDRRKGNNHPHHVDEGGSERSFINGVDDQERSAKKIEQLKDDRIRFYSLIAVESVGDDHKCRSGPAEYVDEQLQFPIPSSLHAIR